MIIKCKMCGGDLHPKENATTCECEYCGSIQTIPNVDDEKKTNLFNRANRLRMNSEFDKASAVYESIVAEFPEEAEAYWGLCLCAYGIEYVDDPATGNKMPTCHRTLSTSIMDDENFEQACDYADTIARTVYRDEAKAIDRIQKEILTIAANEAPYEVFICYKETDENGHRTEDSVLAQDVYDALTAKGLKVFFSRITLEDKLGVQYEPYIYAALSSARVMLAFGTKYEYYDAVWVKNEWKRFLDMMRNDKRKVLIPCFKNLDAYDMPKEFRSLQAQDMNKLGWMQDLIRGIEKLCRKTEAMPAVTVQQQSASNEAVENLMKRARIFLEDGDFENADAYCEKVLDLDAEYAPAYVGKLCAKLKLYKEEQLGEQIQSLDMYGEWKKAMHYANDNQKKYYQGYAEQAELKHSRWSLVVLLKKLLFEKKCQRKVEQEAEQEAERQRLKKYKRADEAMTNGNYVSALFDFKSLGNYSDSEMRFGMCCDKFKKQLVEQKISHDAKLMEMRKKLEEKEKQLSQAHSVVIDAEKKQMYEAKQEQKIAAQIQQYGIELSQIHGIFSGKRRRDLEAFIEEKKRALMNASREKTKWDEKAAAAKNEYPILERAIDEQKAELADAENAIRTEVNNMTVGDILEAARATEVKAAFEAKWSVGNYVTFGTYPQTKTGNDQTAIEWLVLARDGNKALLISRYGLDAQPYNTKNGDIMWETCTLRTWLNSTFLNKAFTSEEQKGIVLTDVDNSKSQGNISWSTSGGNNTQDKIFLLSCAEEYKYYTKGLVEPTAYAIAQGASTSSSYKTVSGEAAGYWWLRSPGSYRGSAACVGLDGSLSYYYVLYGSSCVRPALWVNLESEIFQSGI